MMKLPALAAILITGASAHGFTGTTYTVPGDFETIQSAIDSDLVAAGDTLQLTELTYTESGISTKGKAITITGVTGQPAPIIDGQGSAQAIFVFESGETTTTALENLQITGVASDSLGAIICHDSSPSLSDCTIRDNACCGVWVTGQSQPKIESCRIADNQVVGSTSPASNYGGGITCVNGSAPTIAGSFIEGNVTSGRGGGILVINSNMTATNTVLVRNQAAYGGGVACIGSGTTVFSDAAYGGAGLSITNNNASSGGGGIYVSGSGNANGTVIIDNYVINRNNAPQGSGLLNDFPGSTIRLSLDRFEQNTVQTVCQLDIPMDGVRCCIDDVVEKRCVQTTRTNCENISNGTIVVDCNACQAPTCPGDTDGDQDVDVEDLLLLLGNYGNPCP